MMLGLPDECPMPSNKEIKEVIASLSQSELGSDELKRRLKEMREIAVQIMTVIEDSDPFLIGSTLSGQIRRSSDIDLHAYADDYNVLKTMLGTCGYNEVEEEIIENRKGSFVHLRWFEADYPVEITVYPWSWRHIEPISSVTGKPMKRADIGNLRGLLRRSEQI
jgi:hypothetical protein